ncbi:MAG: hypothetical protein J6K16_06680 [Alphaproteobacteria bacterium]|nr:hypothetical protein [Alphaproteobacteria bacterium]
MTRDEVLKQIGSLSKGEERATLLEDENIRNAVLSSGANVTLYSGQLREGSSFEERFSDVYIGLIQRKNRQGKKDGLGALGGLAERTGHLEFARTPKSERIKLLGQKDDVILDGENVILTDDMEIIRKNNVMREMREELSDLGMDDISINPEKMELIPMPKVKDDNYMINIWDGKGECYAITPYCHLYEDTENLMERIVEKSSEQVGGEVVSYQKVNLFEVLSAFGNKGTKEDSLEDGRNATKDYRYPHEYLVSWTLAAKMLNHNPKDMISLAQEVQQKSDHPVSFYRIAKATGQTMEDVAEIMGIDKATLLKMDEKSYAAEKQKMSDFSVEK